MKFNDGSNLYYVCPFVYTIDHVKVDMSVREDDGTIYYIDAIGAYLREEDLFDNLDEAKVNAYYKLNQFFIKHKYIIENTQP